MNPWVEAVSIVCGACVSTLVASLGFAAFMERWERAEDKIDKSSISADTPIEPYEFIRIGDRCPKCGVKTATHKEHGIESLYGVATYPVSCRAKGIRCLVQKPHLHSRCCTCKVEWLIATKDSQEKK